MDIESKTKNFHTKDLSKKHSKTCLERKTAVQQWDISMSHLESEPSWAQHLAAHRNTSKPRGFILSHGKIAVFLAGKIKQNWSWTSFRMIPYIFLYKIWSPRCFLLVLNGHTAVLELLWFQYCQQAVSLFVQVDWKQNKSRTTVTPPMRQHTHFPVHIQRNV